MKLFKIYLEHYSSESVGNRASQFILAAMKDETGIITTTNAGAHENHSQKKVKLDFAQLLANRVNNKDPSSSVEQSIQFELEKYFNELNVDIKTDVFGWWHQHKGLYPKLHALALKYLIKPGTSTASERVFSTAGLILDDRRSKLTDAHVDMLIF